MKTITENKYIAFRDHNLKFKIIEGMWLTRNDEGKLVQQFNGRQNHDRLHLRYRFENGTTRTLPHKVVVFASKRRFKPRWSYPKGLKL